MSIGGFSDPPLASFAAVNGTILSVIAGTWPGSSIAARFDGTSNYGPLNVTLQEITFDYLNARDNIVGKTACDYGVCKACHNRWLHNGVSCPGIASEPPYSLGSNGVSRKEMCFAGRVKCQRRADAGDDLLRCDSPFEATTLASCDAFAAQEALCTTEIASFSVGGMSLNDLCRAYKTLFDKCRYHGAKRYGGNDYCRNMDTSPFLGSGGPELFPTTETRALILDRCSVAGRSLAASFVTASPPCGVGQLGVLDPCTPPTCSLSCPPCSSGFKCSQQTCQFSSADELTLFAARSGQVQLQPSCRCQRGATPLSVRKHSSGFVQFEWPQIFSCEHSSVFRAGGTGGVSQRFGTTFTCGDVLQYVGNTDSFLITGRPVGTKLSLTVNADVIAVPTNQVFAESEALAADFFVPFEASLAVSIRTERLSPIVNREVTFTIQLTSAQLAAGSPWAAAASTWALLTPGGSGAVAARSLTVSARTDGNGVATVRFVLDARNAAPAAVAALQNVQVVVTPAALENGIALDYTACAAPCSRSFALRHEGVNQQLDFTDTSVATLRGRLPFAISTPECFANDLKVEAFSGATKVSDASTSPNGYFSIIVPRNTPVQLRFARNTVPDYAYFDAARSVILTGTPTIDVAGQAADALVPSPFVLGFVPNTEMGQRGVLQTSVSIPVVGGLCDFPLAVALSATLRMRSESCNDGAPFVVGVDRTVATVVNSGRAIRVSGLAPLLYTDLQLTLSGSDTALAAQTFFGTSHAAQTLDARPYAVERLINGAASNVAASGARPTSLLGDGLLLAMALRSGVADSSPHDHASQATAAAPLAFSSNALQLRANGSALTFGRNNVLDHNDQLTLGLWLDLRALPQRRASLFSQAMVANVTDRFDVELQQTAMQAGGQDFDVVVLVNAREVARSTAVRAISQRTHIAIAFDATELSVFINGVEASKVIAASAPRSRNMMDCNADLQFDCVRTTTIGSSAADASALFDGSIDDLFMVARRLDAATLTFYIAASRDGVAVEALARARPFPRFVFRSDVQLELPRSQRTYFDPPGAAGNKTLAQVLDGLTLAAATCATNEGTRLQPVTIHRVQHTGAVAIQARIAESYGTRKCFRVQGTVKMRSTFTGACSPAATDLSNVNVLPCETTLSRGSFGYVQFFGRVGEATLIPFDKTRADGGARRQFNAFKLDDLRPFLGEFRLRVDAPRNSAEETLLFHVSGFKGPAFPSVYALPVNDVPLLRLSRPPGSASSAFLSRSWARGVQLSVTSESGTQARAFVDQRNDVRVGFSVNICVGAAVAVAVLQCSDSSADAFVQASILQSSIDRSRTSLSVAEAFSSDVLTRFETAISNDAVGKELDIVVTVGITVLITDSFFNTLDAGGNCSIVQTYSPDWRVGDENVVDSLQVTPRGSIKPMIDDWQRQVAVIARDCNNDTALFANCSRLNDAGARVMLNLNETAELRRKFLQASKGARRWRTILSNWEGVFCAALKAAGVPDYYAAPGEPACSTQNSTSGEQIATPAIWNLAGSNTQIDGFVDQARAQQTYVTDWCKSLSTSSGSKLARLSRSFAVNCSFASNANFSALAVPAQNGVYKLAFTGPASFSYATSATISRSESYLIDSTSSWERLQSGTFGFEAQNDYVSALTSVTVGRATGGYETVSMSSVTTTSETTTVGFTISDPSVGDSIGVSVFSDGTFATPIFVTTGGFTRCRREPGTNAREEVLAFPVSTEARPIELVAESTDAEIALDLRALLVSQRAGDTDFAFNIRVANDDDLVVTYKGEYVGVDARHRVILNNSNYTTLAPIRVRRGLRFVYSSVFIYVASECDNSVRAGVYYTLKWQPKCAVTQIDTTAVRSSTSLFTSDREFFVVNSKTNATAVVRVRNPSPTDTPWTLVDGVFTIKAQLRAKGEQSQWIDVPGGVWPQLQFCKNEARPGASPSCYERCTDSTKCCQGVGAVCSASEPCCLGVGLVCGAGVCQYANLPLNASLPINAGALALEEGEYELRAVTVCGGGALSTASAVVGGRIDRVAPRQFGTSEPASGVWWPGDEISIAFTEDVACERPFAFKTSLAIGSFERPVENAVDVVCDKNKIQLALSRTVIEAPDDLLGRRVTLRVSNVADLALNVLTQPAEWQFLIGAIDESLASVSLKDIRLPLALFQSGNVSEVIAAATKALFGDLGSDAAARVRVNTSAAQTGGDVASFDVTIAPLVAGGRRRVGGDSALRLANALLKRDAVDSSAAIVAINAPRNGTGTPPASATQRDSTSANSSAGASADDGIGSSSSSSGDGGAGLVVSELFDPIGGLPGLIGIVVGGAVLLIGLTVLVVCLVTRRRARPAQPVPSQQQYPYATVSQIAETSTEMHSFGPPAPQEF